MNVKTNTLSKKLPIFNMGKVSLPFVSLKLRFDSDGLFSNTIVTDFMDFPIDYKKC